MADRAPKPIMRISRLHHAFAALIGFSCVALAIAACDKANTGPSASASASAPAASSAERPVVLKTFTGLGIKFQYPEPYSADVATSNPVVHQVALDHHKEPGVLTIRFNPEDPKAPILLEDVALATKQRMGEQTTVEPAKLTVAGKTYEARAVKANQLGLVATTDTVAVVTLGDRTYIVLTHTSDVDKDKAQKMFDVVLRTLTVE